MQRMIACVRDQGEGEGSEPNLISVGAGHVVEIQRVAATHKQRQGQSAKDVEQKLQRKSEREKA